MQKQKGEKIIILEGKKPTEGKTEVRSSVLEKGDRDGAAIDNKN